MSNESVIERDFAGKVKAIIRALCHWPEWKVFWDIKVSTFYRFITGRKLRIFDFLAISKKSGKIRIYEVKRTLSHAKRSIGYQVAQDSKYGDELYIVAPQRVIDKIYELVPDYIGLISIPLDAKISKDGIPDLVLREAAENPNLDLWCKFILLKDIDATIESWRNRIISAVHSLSKKLCEDCSHKCDSKIMFMKELILLQLASGKNTENKIDFDKLSDITGMKTKDIENFVNKIPCFNVINDFISFVRI